MSNKREFDNFFEYINEKKKEKWLIHIKTEIIEPGLVFDISEHKIYYDSIVGNFRRKLQCECGADLGCFCFGGLEGAMKSVDCTLAICNRCYMKDPDVHEADYIQSMMHDLYPGRTVDKMDDIEIEVIMGFIREHHNDDYNEADMEVCGI